MLQFSDDSGVDDDLSSPSLEVLEPQGGSRAYAKSGGHSGGRCSGVKTAAAGPQSKKRRPTETPAPRHDEDDEDDEDDVSQTPSGGELDVMLASFAQIIQQQKSKSAKKGASEKKKIVTEYKAAIKTIEEEFTADLGKQGGELMHEVQRMVKAIAAEHEKQDKEDAAFNQELAAFGRDAAAFEKRIKAEVKNVGASKGAAEGACDKLVDAHATYARALVEKTMVESRRIRAKKLTVEPIITTLAAAVAEMEGGDK
uniref:Uncharacterized protein n=1 Tax=Coccolithus braarudii TaxID=221442 RepID=A0A7S0LGW6_9EUKA|mmetsp:Transcript_39861/g.85026  ORF Transcript_39861/g.85026 Transcript_39861/m.85026 type:complete len:255 (+) Transcript_39861:63-827(+)|eukprot:CAMPEP_0183331990 /NCGR_PEP_ID=MMETSP0164_2-20130417/1253_1 /TAXON_ID=221442 /ORGANISM="Coccolithus pelagicus ssp braarudi, Strain PLY182g" /LENGTH=254 /DNA_ID=CAMNT_0025500611 /DNA_START=63 /DNA_END=827 /DNA_ORIENTATION=+